MQSLYAAFANAVLVLHAGFVLFVVAGLVLILLGGARGWPRGRHLRFRVRNPWFRWLHLAAIAYVVLESWLGIVCPLTTLEIWLRTLAGQTTYDGDFIAYWLRRGLFFTAPSWVFTLCHSAFGALVLVSWFGVRPRRLWRAAA